MRVLVIAVGILLGGCDDGAKQAQIGAVIDAAVDDDPLVQCRLPTECGDATPNCCVRYSPGGAFEGSMCSAQKCFWATCDPHAAQPCTGSGVCEQIGGYGDNRKWWTCECEHGICPQ